MANIDVIRIIVFKTVRLMHVISLKTNNSPPYHRCCSITYCGAKVSNSVYLPLKILFMLFLSFLVIFQYVTCNSKHMSFKGAQRSYNAISALVHSWGHNCYVDITLNLNATG